MSLNPWTFLRNTSEAGAGTDIAELTNRAMDDSRPAKHSCLMCCPEARLVQPHNVLMNICLSHCKEARAKTARDAFPAAGRAYEQSAPASAAALEGVGEAASQIVCSESCSNCMMSSIRKGMPPLNCKSISPHTPTLIVS